MDESEEGEFIWSGHDLILCLFQQVGLVIMMKKTTRYRLICGKKPVGLSSGERRIMADLYPCVHALYFFSFSVHILMRKVS